MSSQNCGTPTIVIEAENAAARVVIPASADPAGITGPLLCSLARERGVELPTASQELLAAIADAFRASPADVDEVFATAEPPRHGRDEEIAWEPGFDPAAARVAKAGAKGSVDFYAATPFTCVRLGDRVATILPPTPGVHGRDVCGGILAASDGGSLNLQIDSTMELRRDGGLYAIAAGRLQFDGQRMLVEPLLDIPGTVDFHTGHVDFDGDVHIQDDIRDRFRVRATRSVRIDGLVDCCSIDCGQDLLLRRGAAGRGEGKLKVGGDAAVGYLDQVEGEIRGKLTFSSQLRRCVLRVGGDLVGERGGIVGGRILVGGSVRLSELGSDAETPTEIILGDPFPGGRGQASAAAEHRRVEGLRAELRTLRSIGANSAAAVERMTVLEFEISEFERAAGAVPVAIPAPEAVVEVAKAIHPKVSLGIAGGSYVFTEAVRGPVKVWQIGREAYCALGAGAPQPLRALTGIRLRAA